MNELTTINMNKDGTILASELYEKLGLNKGNYARWCETNIINNDMWTDGKDYFIITPESAKLSDNMNEKDYERLFLEDEMVSEPAETLVLRKEERTDIGVQPNPSFDYGLSTEFAKFLAISSNSPKKKEIALRLSTYESREVLMLKKQVAEMMTLIENLSKQTETNTEAIEDFEESQNRDRKKVRKLEESVEAIKKSIGTEESAWKRKTRKNIEILRHKVVDGNRILEYSITKESLIETLIRKAGIDLDKERSIYMLDTNNFTPDALDIIDHTMDLRRRFEKLMLIHMDDHDIKSLE